MSDPILMTKDVMNKYAPVYTALPANQRTGFEDFLRWLHELKPFRDRVRQELNDWTFVTEYVLANGAAMDADPQHVGWRMWAGCLENLNALCWDCMTEEQRAAPPDYASMPKQWQDVVDTEQRLKQLQILERYAPTTFDA